MHSVASMRKTIPLLGLFLCACGGSSKQQQPPPPSPPAAKTVPAPVVTADSTGIPECDAYLAAGRRLADCPDMPEDARQAQHQDLDEKRSAIQRLMDGETEITPEAMKSVVDSCIQATRAVEEAYERACQDEAKPGQH
jgi:hypothetical protein